MSFVDACRAAYRGYVSRPAGVFPYYLLGMSSPAIAQTVWLFGLVATYAALARQNAIAELRATLADVGPVPIDDVAAVEATAEDFESVVEAALSAEVLAIVGVTVFVAVVALFLVNAVVSAGQIHAVYAVLRGRPPVRAGVDGIVRDARPFALLTLLEIVLAVAVSAVIFGVVALAGGGVGLVVLGTFVWLGAILLLRLSFLFTPQAVVVDGVGVWDALARNLRFVRANVLATVLYALLVVAAAILVGTVGGVLSVLQSSTATSLVVSLIVIPGLDFVKTVLYARHAKGHLPVPEAPERPLRTRFVADLRRGWRELWAFVRTELGVLGASAAVAVASAALGIYLGGLLDPYVEASIARRLEGIFPPAFFLELAANNWQVAIAQSYAGLAVGVPTLVTLFLNGAHLGVLFRIDTDPGELVAFVLPHGVVEIPAFVISGAVGLYLGVVVARAIRGRRGRADVAAAIERAYHVVVGLALLFVVAAAIEAFVSPFYYHYL